MPRSRITSPARSTHHTTRSAGKLGRDDEPEPIRVARTDGLHVVAEDGKRYLDLTAGWCVGNLGWGKRELLDAIERFDGPHYVSPHLEYPPWDDLAAELCEVAPGRMQRAYRATGGSEAVDLALQAAMLATERKKFVALAESYHGNTLAGLAVSGEGPGNVLRGSKQLRGPYDEKALSKVETALKKKDVAAVILEPVSMNLGVEVPDPEFMHGLEQLCKEHGTLLIADEVATGFGRTGKMFASEHYDLQPDMVCLAKAITSGVAPMGALLMTKQVADDIEEDFTSYSTYGWHPLAVEVARANLAYWRKHGRALLRDVNARGDQLQARLEEMEFGGEAEVKVKGLAAAVHLDDKEYVETIADACRRRAVLLSPSDDVLQLFPPLTIDERTLDRALDVLEGCV